ncbi:MAG: thioredoxin-disulfide reductase [Bacteroidales bacterium]|nr:thioredoxin-disulfide reductase [Bacteroidales bacterium]
MTTTHTKCLIIGSGPAGYTAGIYASRAGLKPIIISGPLEGGQLTTTNEIENYPGFPNAISGYDLTDLMKNQAEKFGTQIISGTVIKTDFSEKPFIIETDDKNIYKADSVILATGASAKYLGLESEKKYLGSGVSACAVCDGFFYKKQDVIVVGGGDTAVSDALYLSNICNKVYLAVRKNYLRASDILQKRLSEAKNIEVLYEHVVTDIYGENGVEGVTLKYKLGTTDEISKNLKVTGYFVAIGRQPQTEIFASQIKTDKLGYIVTEKNSTKTNIAGVFACGDCADSIYRQAIVAAGSGCKAALDAEKYLNENAIL